ncbi:MAG: hypothetical protein JOZ01_00805, partial [Candidatus Eremiobacteraeota bacterium]|nr:hypothetical protein [Candidatus Eremiobacteraeota bacterium]
VALLLAMALAPRVGSSQAAPPTLAELGVELPTLGGAKWWSITQRSYVNATTLRDIRENLHASYVRTGWIPGRLVFEKFRWRREDNGMDTICGSGLRVMMLVPSPKDDGKGLTDLVDNIREFFARYTAREPGCIQYAEMCNEADLRSNGFADVRAYAAFYARVAPVIAAYGIPIITSGVSGEDRPWTATLATILNQAKPNVQVAGYGFHPYGVPPVAMADAVLAMRQAAGALPSGHLPDVFVTEIGEANAKSLYATIVNLAHVTPTITLYEYLAQPGEDARYGLKNNPALYQAVQAAWEELHASRP